MTETRGIRPLVVVCPVPSHFDERYPFRGVHRTIAPCCHEFTLDFFDLLPLFEGRDDQPLWVHRSDQNPNEIAQ